MKVFLYLEYRARLFGVEMKRNKSMPLGRGKKDAMSPDNDAWQQFHKDTRTGELKRMTP